jgi:hypothetical protein
MTAPLPIMCHPTTEDVLNHGGLRPGLHYDSPGLALGQHWLDTPEPGLRPGEVWVSSTSHALQVFASLEDDVIGNSARGERQPTWSTGDVLEIFLRPDGQDAYFEFHITPENETLRVRFPSERYFAAMARQYPRDPNWVFDLSLAHNCIQTATQVIPESRRWNVAAVIPFTTVLENGETFPSRPWRVSFCRYDTTPGLSKPVLSSTSPYSTPKFHDQSAWRELRFVPLS